MKVIWSIILLASLVLAVAVPVFFGHGLIAHGGPWFMLAGACLVIAAALFFVQIRFRRDAGPAHH
ncbi:MAG: hypothetical protein ACT4O1_17780 [Gemmatimonadota bacterium]